MNIIACLGNPERKYSRTRHNIGFIIGEYLAAEYKILLNQKNFSSIYGQGSVNGNNVIILLPLTYMNNSGQAVRSVLDYYKTKLEKLIVIHDEIELPFGEFRLKKGGGHKGHNGLRSIIQHCGSADFTRLRFGVGRPAHQSVEVADYVLSNFTKEELVKIENIFPEVRDLLLTLFDETV